MRFCETNPNCLREITGGCNRAVKTYDAQIDFSIRVRLAENRG